MQEIAKRVENVGAAKARLPLLSMFMLGMLVMAWADGKLSTRHVLRNWMVVCAANFIGALGLAMMLKASGAALLPGGDAKDAWGLAGILLSVIAGNLAGGSVLVALVYHIIYRRPGLSH